MAAAAAAAAGAWALGVALGLGAEEEAGDDAPEGLVAAEVASVGIERISGTPVALLREQGGGRFIPISIGIAEARAIAWVLAGVEAPRPMTHDLMAALLGAAEFGVERVVVHSLVDGVYFARIEGQRSGETGTVEIDSRPSDAMALALRLDAPILVAETLLERIPLFDFSPGAPEEQILRVLGATVVTATGEDLESAGLEPGTPALRVVAAGGDGGLAEGDLILKADGRPLDAPETLLEVLRGKEAEAMIRLEIRREGETSEIELPALPPLRPGRRDAGAIA